MTPEQQRIKIAEACGWKHHHTRPSETERHQKKWRYLSDLPDYLNDLNAMYEAEKVLKYFPDYLFHLREIVGPFPDAMSEWSDYHWQDVVHATAAQRAEAFGLTLNLWK